MCGITAYIGNEKCIDIITNSLKTLSNRGYDSAGFVLSDTSTGDMVTKKSITKNDKLAIDELVKASVDVSGNYNVGVGHTRWATHGMTNEANCHPHTDSNKNFYLVHNGIIENYKELKVLLLMNGYTFYSDTDTEVIVNLLDYYYKKTDNMIASIEDVMNSLEGTFGVCFYHINHRSKLFCFKQGSPIMVSINEGFAMVSSEISGFNGLTSKYFSLDNDDYCVIEIAEEEISLVSGNVYSSLEISKTMDTNEKGEFEHWTLKEIYEQPIALQRAINNGARLQGDYNSKLGGLETYAGSFSDITNCLIIGCGTSHFAANIGVDYFRRLTAFDRVLSIDGCEFVEDDLPRSGKTLAILLSQSGETRDLYNCLSILKKRGIVTLGCINVPDSLIAQEVDCGVYLNAGKEIGVASTKSFTSQLVILCLVAIWFGQGSGGVERMRIGKYIASIRKLTTEVQSVIRSRDYIESLIRRKSIFSHPSLFILGKGRMFNVACEGALKIKELSYCHAEAYSGSALKHGPFSLLEEGFPVIAIIHKDEFYSKMCSAFEEIKSRGADIIVITNDPSFDHKNKIVVNATNEMAEIPYVVVLQFIAYFMSIHKKINPDYPRNLAKVVTVE